MASAARAAERLNRRIKGGQRSQAGSLSTPLLRCAAAPFNFCPTHQHGGLAGAVQRHRIRLPQLRHHLTHGGQRQRLRKRSAA